MWIQSVCVIYFICAFAADVDSESQAAEVPLHQENYTSAVVNSSQSLKQQAGSRHSYII